MIKKTLEQRQEKLSLLLGELSELQKLPESDARTVSIYKMRNRIYVERNIIKNFGH